MFDLGMQELIVIFVVALLVFGPKRLPELSRALGKGIRELKTALRGVQESMQEAETNISEEIMKEKQNIKNSLTKEVAPETDSKAESGEKTESETDLNSGMAKKEIKEKTGKNKYG